MAGLDFGAVGKGSVARVERSGLQVETTLAAFIEDRALVAAGIDADRFWPGFADLVARFAPANKALLQIRAEMQARISKWHQDRAGEPHDPGAYRAFLKEIGYLVPAPADPTITTANTDPEFATLAGPQLVVPVTNARYALNAANARWGSLYDALYGTDAMGSLPPAGEFDTGRAAQVIAWARGHLDAAVPLSGGSWADITGLEVADGVLDVQGAGALADPSQFAGSTRGPDGALTSVLLRKNGLLIRIMIDPSHAIGAQDAAGISDVLVEAAVSTIMDCEDSVACVDGPDKALAYSNWLGLMTGDLVRTVTKGGQTFTRALAPDLSYIAPDGTPATHKGRAAMLVRNVGLLMTTPAVLDARGAEIPEELLDAMVTTLCAMPDLARAARGESANSPAGSIYVVKPKMHGPDEVAHADAVFTAVETALGLPANTVKLGIMDEERRTSVNLAACIAAARARVAFINTGFLDRTGDEMHTSMAAGPMIRKAEMKGTAWIAAYEDQNVDIGLAAGLSGSAQIGKGMWAMPDLMQAMFETKDGHPKAGANTAWVPSPTAAVLHALHYHLTDVFAVQRDLAAGGARTDLDDLLTIPLGDPDVWSDKDVAAELDNNAQGILGYTVRWVDQGVGCSKVPDINNIGLMEDRATCRISAQHMANWLAHGVATEAQIRETFARMAVVVDRQNADDPAYVPMAPSLDGIAYRTALALVLEGIDQPSGYTEPLLHAGRLARKAQLEGKTS